MSRIRVSGFRLLLLPPPPRRPFVPSARVSLCSHVLLSAIRVHGGTSRGKLAERGATEGWSGAGDNNHNNLVKRYKDISR